MAIFTIKLPADALFLSLLWHLCVPLVHLHSSAFLVISLEICHVLGTTMAPGWAWTWLAIGKKVTHTQLQVYIYIYMYIYMYVHIYLYHIAMAAGSILVVN